MTMLIFPGWPSHWLLWFSRLAEAGIQKVDGHEPRCRKVFPPEESALLIVLVVYDPPALPQKV